jgi:hypothetical protein
MDVGGLVHVGGSGNLIMGYCYLSL